MFDTKKEYKNVNEIIDIIKNELDYVNMVTINDYRKYESSTSCNGGNYSYYTHISKLDNDMWYIRYETSSEFPFCQYCGSFGEDDHSEYETISFDELIEIIKREELLNGDDYYITIK